MSVQPTFGITRILNAVRFSVQGIKATWKSEAAFREEVLLGIVLFPAAFWLGESLTQTALLLFPLFIVLIVELLNTGIEHAINRFGPERHEISGLAKDAGSAAVFLSNLQVICIWTLVALDRFIF